MYLDGVYYWYGENKEKTDGKNGIWHWGVRCYSSNDLYNWQDLGLIIPPDTEDETSPLHPTAMMDRPHMDTRLEALFTYAVSTDAALARKALVDFHYGMQPKGLTTGKYPSVYLQILSTFSLHYIYMLREYLQQKQDKLYKAENQHDTIQRVYR